MIRKFLDFVVSYFKVPAGRKQYFDENLNREQWDLLEAAAMLQVTEFRIFELAYKDWYGVLPKAQVAEVHFRNYMFNQIIPVWVSGFCRRIVDLGQSGALNPKDFGIYQRLPSRRMMRIGQVYTAMLVVAFLFLVYMAYYGEFFSELLYTNANVYPPDVRLP
jgi:hypothetical protein